MRRHVGRALVVLTVLVVVACATAFGYRAWRQQQAERAIAIATVNGIDEAQFVRVGDIDQWVTIRGDDRANPVLLILAGGPGNSLVPLASVFRNWEAQFTVVQWDQRGAGKTFGRNGERETPMTVARMRDDGIELTQWLLAHLQKRKLVIVGHSWGSILGVLMAKARPDLFYAFVGTGQVVAKQEKEAIIYAALMQKVIAANDTGGRERLDAIGPPPYASEQELLVERAVSERYDTDAERNLENALRPVVVFAPHFSLYDIYAMLQGSKFAADALYAETLGYDARALGTKFDVPFFVVNGELDLITPTDLAQRYFVDVEAPQKAFVVLPGGGHSAMLTMPDAFLAELTGRVRPLAVVD